MQIISPGFNHHKWRRKILCHNCDATLQVDKNDIFIAIKDPPHDGETLIACLCLSCGEQIQISNDVSQWKDVPDVTDFRCVFG